MTIEIKISQEQQRQITLDYLNLKLEDCEAVGRICESFSPKLYDIALEQKTALKTVIQILEKEI